MGDFPARFTALGQKGFLGPIPLSLWLFLVFALVVLGVLLHRTGFGRQVVVIGTNAEVAQFSGLDVARVKTVLFLMASTMAALCGVLYTRRGWDRCGALSATGFGLDVITMVLLGGVSIFGGKGSMPGVILSILIILNLRNGMALTNITGHIQTGVIGILLPYSVLGPNLWQRLRRMMQHAFKMYLNPGMEAEYIRRHDAIWPELVALLRGGGVELLDPPRPRDRGAVLLRRAEGTGWRICRRIR